MKKSLFYQGFFPFRPIGKTSPDFHSSYHFLHGGLHFYLQTYVLFLLFSDFFQRWILPCIA